MTGSEKLKEAATPDKENLSCPPPAPALVQIAPMRKTCHVCQKSKPLAAFNRACRGTYGVDSRCRACNKAHLARYRKTPGYSSRQQQHVRRYERRYPERHRARRLAHLALKRGEITRLDACERCHREGPTEFHHSDYARPLEIEQLCPPCHVVADKERRSQEAEVAA